MKRLFPILLACLLPFIAQAQDTIPADSEQEIFIDRYKVLKIASLYNF